MTGLERTPFETAVKMCVLFGTDYTTLFRTSKTLIWFQKYHPEVKKKVIIEDENTGSQPCRLKAVEV